MLFFIPSYDEATKANLDVVRPILPQNCTLLLTQNATRSLLLHHLELNDTMFVMSHGNSDNIWDNNKESALGLNDTFFHKKAFVFACFTANQLSKHWQANNNIYWGYKGSISAPSRQIRVSLFFSTIFKNIIENFPICENVLEIRNFIETLKTLCAQVENEIDNLYNAGEPVDVINCYTCLFHIWSRLRVCHFAHFDTIQHPEAREGDLFE
jgi:hypothetical protein